MNSVENYAIRYLEPKDVKDLDQYNALLRYTFQVTEDELTATGWKDEEIKQSKFPVLERADVLGCFDGDTLISQFAVYPLKMNIYGEVFPVGFQFVQGYPTSHDALASGKDLLVKVVPFG